MINTDRIDAILNEFLEPFELTVFAGTDFAYYHSSSTIEYAFVVSERMDNLFMKNAKRLGLKHNVDTFLLSLLHEVGHNETIDDLDDAIYNYCLDIKEMLDADCDEDVYTYLNLFDEKEATLWAIDYINNHTEEIEELWNKLQPAILEFYIKNGVEF